ncbi:MAG: putative DNA-binding domain-containing protein [Rhodomicrobium sp.]
MRGGMMMTLKQVQDSFQQALLSGAGDILTQLADGPREPKGVLLGLYQDGYILRLIEFAQKDHELLHAYLGDEGFDEMARSYAAAYPSRYRNAIDFCAHLPQYLAEAQPYSAHAEISELAALEKALNDAFYAKDQAAIGVSELAGYAPGDWAFLRFTAHPSAIRLGFKTNAADIWSALKHGGEPPAALADGPHRLLVWRQATPKFRVLGEEEAMLWDEAASGVRFGILCEMAAAYDDPDSAAARTAGCLQGWITSGLLAGAALR